MTSRGVIRPSTTFWWTISYVFSPRFKKVWGDRVTTVFVRQGKFALDPAVIASFPPADVTVERISDLLGYDLPTLLAGEPSTDSSCFPSPATTK